MNSRIALKFKWFFGGFLGLFLKISPIIVLIFISTGDKFLPSPLSDYSSQTRTSINNFLVGLFPKDVNSPYKSKQNDKIIEQMEKSGAPSQSPSP